MVWALTAVLAGFRGAYAASSTGLFRARRRRHRADSGSHRAPSRGNWLPRDPRRFAGAGTGAPGDDAAERCGSPDAVARTAGPGSSSFEVACRTARGSRMAAGAPLSGHRDGPLIIDYDPATALLRAGGSGGSYGHRPEPGVVAASFMDFPWPMSGLHPACARWRSTCCILAKHYRVCPQRGEFSAVVRRHPADGDLHGSRLITVGWRCCRR